MASLSKSLDTGLGGGVGLGAVQLVHAAVVVGNKRDEVVVQIIILKGSSPPHAYLNYLARNSLTGLRRLAASNEDSTMTRASLKRCASEFVRLSSVSCSTQPCVSLAAIAPSAAVPGLQPAAIIGQPDASATCMRLVEFAGTSTPDGRLLRLKYQMSHLTCQLQLRPRQV
ncbi:hypothetical protein T492DRAFT_1141550 [Pavlovales sp. CCMP2436]|nr:hypothetical protein T492DRAFT_1141550 [Pavlovales sp. CCMP2436]